MRTKLPILLLVCLLFFFAQLCTAQTSTGTLDVTVHITPTGARPEPVRQFTLYFLTKSYADIVKEVEGNDILPTREEFIDNLKCTPQLKKWLKAHEVMDLTMPDFDKLVTPIEIMEVPEFLAAYQRSNSGGVTNGLPIPRFREADREGNPEKYEKQRQEYVKALKKFVETHPATVTGMELELAGVNPKYQWDKLHGGSQKEDCAACSGHCADKISCGQGRYGHGRAGHGLRACPGDVLGEFTEHGRRLWGPPPELGRGRKGASRADHAGRSDQRQRH